MIFRIDQVALNPLNADSAQQMLNDMGLKHWLHEDAQGTGEVFGDGAVNTVDRRGTENLALDSLSPRIELVDYKKGDNWIAEETPCVAYLGMTCDMDELKEWHDFFTERGIRVAQSMELVTTTGEREKQMVFETRHIIGTDLQITVNMDGE